MVHRWSWRSDYHLKILFLIVPHSTEEKVREQIKRMDIALLILRLSGSFSKSMSWVDFFNRYHSLKPFPARNFDVNNRRDYEKLRELCSELYKMFGAVFRGGNGRVIANEDVVLLDERAWWSLERNLSFLQTKSRLRHTVDPSREGTRWEYESIASDGSDMEGADMEERIRREAVLNRKRKGRNDHVKLSPQRTWWLKYTWLFSWWVRVS